VDALVSLTCRSTVIEPVEFERIVQRHGMEKIKTIGDAFMATANLLQPNADPVMAASTAAILGGSPQPEHEY
jgi:class 3 adenylate cyclase